MSQREFLREFDSDAAEAFMDAGIADVATYKPAGIGTTAIPDCSLLIDRSVTYQDAQSGIVSTSIQITAFRADIGEENPRKSATFTLGDDIDEPIEVFVVDRIIENSDESRVVMLVTPRP